MALEALAAVLVLLAARQALAHGGPPVIEGALASDEAGPFLVELSEGFALREPTSSTATAAGARWSFLCPALVGAELPPKSASAGSAAWLAGSTDLYRLDAHGHATAMGHPELSSGRVLELAVRDDALLALRWSPAHDAGPGGSDLVVLRDDRVETLLQAEQLFSGLAVLSAADPNDSDGARVWLARIEGELLEVLELSANGTVLHREHATLPMLPQAVRLSVAGEHVFAHLTGDAEHALAHVATLGVKAFAPVVVVTATLPVRGPAMRGHSILLTRDQELLLWTPDGVTPSSSPLGTEPLTCLSSSRVCTRSQLHDADRVEQTGAFTASSVLFDLAKLEPPRHFPEDPELHDDCELQWQVFRADLVRAEILGERSAPDAGSSAAPGEAGASAASSDGGLEAGEASSKPRTARGCSVATSNRTLLPFVPCVLFALARLARRQTKRKTVHSRSALRR